MSLSDKITLSGLGITLNETSFVESNFRLPNHYTQLVTLNPGEIADLEIAVLYGATGNDLVLRVVKTLDTSNERPQDVAFVSGSIFFSPNNLITRPITIINCYKFRVEVIKGGTDAGNYTPNVYLRKNGINV